MPTSETTLLVLMQSGDLLALDRFVRESSDTLMAVARRQCHLAADAEDAVQQALLVASTAMTGIRGDGAPLAWLSTLVARSCYRLNAVAARADELTEPPCSCDDPAVLAERRELTARLSDALMTLSRTDRVAFLLSVEGFTSVEIAEHLALSHDAVRSRLKRARQHLRVAVGDTLEVVDGTEAHDPSRPPQRDR